MEGARLRAGSLHRSVSVAPMHTIELTDEELRLLQNALHAYLDDFGHEEADVLREVKALIEKLRGA